MPPWLLPVLPFLGLTIPPMLTYMVMRQKNTNDDNKNKADGQSQLTTSIIAFSDRKDAEISALNVRVASLERINQDKDTRIQVLVSENFDLQRQLNLMQIQQDRQSAKIADQDANIAELREEIRRIKAGSTTTTAGVIMTTTTNPTAPQAQQRQQRQSGSSGVNEETSKVDITINEDPNASQSQPLHIDGDGKGKQKKIPKTTESTKSDNGSDG